ncbi:MAG: type 4a pilus biogenesis protein PilO [Sedimentisphaerales bacterium]|nr:type 4a pilus biogenesis protein PilO [Sedimentisphaerales bacterium]
MRSNRSSSMLHRQQVWVYVVGFLFVADFIFYGYLPSHRRLQSLAEARLQKERLIETAESQARALPGLEQTLETVEKAVLHYEDRIPAETDGALGTFWNQVSVIMSSRSLTDPVMEPKDVIVADNLKCIPVRIKCKGALESIFGFCNDLRELDRLVRIERLTLTNDSDFSGVISLEAEAVIFYRSEKGPGESGLAGVIPPGGLRNDT